MPQFFRVKPIWFLAKRESGKKLAKIKEKKKVIETEVKTLPERKNKGKRLDNKDFEIFYYH